MSEPCSMCQYICFNPRLEPCSRCGHAYSSKWAKRDYSSIIEPLSRLKRNQIDKHNKFAEFVFSEIMKWIREEENGMNLDRSSGYQPIYNNINLPNPPQSDTNASKQ